MNRNKIEIGTVWVDWQGEIAHRLFLDLMHFAWYVDTPEQFWPLAKYLEMHPDRSDEVRRAVESRLR